MIPEYLMLGSLKIYSFSIFVFVAVLLTSYVIWLQARKEGFDEEFIFDSELIVLLTSIFVGRLVFALSTYPKFTQVVIHVVKFWTYGMSFIGMAVSAIFMTYSLAKIKNWSVNRIMDIFTMGAAAGIPVFLLSKVLIYDEFSYLIAIGILMLLLVWMLILREKGFVFGGLFGLYLAVASLVFTFYFKDKLSLIFFTALFTLGSVVLIKRFGKNKVKIQSPISKDFLANIKNTLLRKEKRLVKEDELLKKEDSFAVPDRTLGNSEDADEAVEDVKHLETDMLRGSVRAMRRQVRMALSKINIGTYGLCEVCKKPIDKARLKALPEATTCIDHADGVK